MKKGLIIVVECILLIIVLLIIKLILRDHVSGIVDNDAVSFVFYFLAAIGSILIYRKNAKNR